MARRGPPRVVPVAVSEITLPATPFLYTLDQVAILLNWSEAKLRVRCHFAGRSLESKTPDDIAVMNIAKTRESPDWRVSENEFLRWLMRHGYEVTKRNY